jgi:serine/threonine-protein kinase
MNARKQLQTAPEIRVALSGLEESAPLRTTGGGAAGFDSLPASGAVPVTQDEVVKLPFSFGDVIADKYEIVGLIGAGGVGYVVSAMHLELGELVALKLLREESLAHPEVVARFSREARAAAKIKSEYVARVFDVGALPNGTPFIVMEYLQGHDLADVLRAQGKLPIKVAVEYMMQSCEALASAHASGIVHRDIKPENLFLTRQGEGIEIIKVLDFGISKVALSSARQAVPRQFVRTMLPMGTPAYMSPEQIRATGEVDARTDIWALGCVLFELLTGACAFDAPTIMQLGAAILERDPRPLRTFIPDAPVELEQIVSRCLEKDPDKRFQDVAELALALYPFGPRRARLSAERSNYLLKGSMPSGSPLELGSVPPAPLLSVATSAAPVISAAAPAASGAPIVSIEAPRQPTGTELAIQPRSKARYFIGGAAVAALLGGYALLRPPSPVGGNPKASAPVSAPAAQNAAAAVTAPPPAARGASDTSASASLGGDVDPAATPSARGQRGPSSSASSGVKNKLVRPIHGRAPIASGSAHAKSGRGEDGELDVGY